MEKVSKDTDRDFILTADQAVEYGTVDEIITSRGITPVLAAGGANGSEEELSESSERKMEELPKPQKVPPATEPWAGGSIRRKTNRCRPVNPFLATDRHAEAPSDHA
jgi:hypothetical protein